MNSNEEIVSFRWNQRKSDERDVSQPITANSMCATTSSSLAAAQTKAQSHPFLFGQFQDTTKLQTISHELNDINYYNMRMICENEDGLYGQPEIVRLSETTPTLIKTEFDKTNCGYICGYSTVGQQKHAVEICDINSNTISVYDSLANEYEEKKFDEIIDINKVYSVSFDTATSANPSYRGPLVPFCSVDEKLILNKLMDCINKFDKSIKNWYNENKRDKFNEKWSQGWMIPVYFNDIFMEENGENISIYFMGIIGIMMDATIKQLKTKNRCSVYSILQVIDKMDNDPHKWWNTDKLKLKILTAFNWFFSIQTEDGKFYIKQYKKYRLSLRKEFLMAIFPRPIFKQISKNKTGHKEWTENMKWYANRINRMDDNNNNNNNNNKNNKNNNNNNNNNDNKDGFSFCDNRSEAKWNVFQILHIVLGAMIFIGIILLIVNGYKMGKMDYKYNYNKTNKDIVYNNWMQNREKNDNINNLLINNNVMLNMDDNWIGIENGEKNESINNILINKLILNMDDYWIGIENGEKNDNINNNLFINKNFMRLKKCIFYKKK